MLSRLPLNHVVAAPEEVSWPSTYHFTWFAVRSTVTARCRHCVPAMEPELGGGSKFVPLFRRDT
ncbi:MAG: hypothetical protein KatS3mg077_1245 [Candidatus Binatia bacterium]|nr:MAG: hypothetical protein KatS3mg077_1245 [Candidatus Binatia bacterium]